MSPDITAANILTKYVIILLHTALNFICTLVQQMKEDLKKENASTKLLAHMTGFCFHSIYIDTILTSGYGFNETTFTDIEFLKHVSPFFLLVVTTWYQLIMLAQKS